MSDADDTLIPERLRATFAKLRCAPWTEIKSALACAGFVATGAWLMIASGFHLAVDHEALDAWLTFLAGAWGIATAGQGWKQTVAAKVASAAPKDGAP